MPENLHQLSGCSSPLSIDPSTKAMTINPHGLTDISKVSKSGEYLVDFIFEVERASKP